MKKRNVILIIVAMIVALGFLKQQNVKNFFIHKRYYPAFVALGLAETRYNFYKHFYKIFDQEGIHFATENRDIINDSLSKLSNRAAQPVSKLSIPAITHNIYFTFSTAKLNDYYVENLKQTFMKLEQADSNSHWVHYLWTNNPDIFPAEFKNRENIKIKSIDEFKAAPIYPYLEKALDNGKKIKAYLAESSDIVRFLALKKYGGIYTDLDYEIYNPPMILDMMKKFSLIAGRDTVEIKRSYLIGFIASAANHPVIDETLRLLYRNNSLSLDTPDYIRYPVSEGARIYYNGPPLFTMAYFNKYNSNGNSDVILPSWMMYNQAFIRKKNKYCDLSKISKEEFLKNNDNIDSLIAEYTKTAPNQTAEDGEVPEQDQNIYYNTKYREGFPIIGADMSCGSWSDHQFPKLYYWKIPFFKEAK